MDYLSVIALVFVVLAIITLFFPKMIIDNNRKKMKEGKVCTQCYSKELVETKLILNENDNANFKAYECKECGNIVIRKK